jgi:hypothetical protein
MPLLFHMQLVPLRRGGNEPPPDPLAKHKDLVTRIVHLPARDSYATTSRDGGAVQVESR